PFLTSFSSAGSTRTRSPRGFTLIAIFCLVCWFDLVLVESNPVALAPGKGWLCTARWPEPARRCKAKMLGLFLVHDFGVDDRLVLAPFRLGAARWARAGAGGFLARFGFLGSGFVKLGRDGLPGFV